MLVAAPILFVVVISNPGDLRPPWTALAAVALGLGPLFGGCCALYFSKPDFSKSEKQAEDD